jgi:hypothetical protein
LYDVITGTDPEENIVSDPLLLHDVITGTDPKEKTAAPIVASGRTTKKTLPLLRGCPLLCVYPLP